MKKAWGKPPIVLTSTCYRMIVVEIDTFKKGFFRWDVVIKYASGPRKVIIILKKVILDRLTPRLSSNKARTSTLKDRKISPSTQYRRVLRLKGFQGSIKKSSPAITNEIIKYLPWDKKVYRNAWSLKRL